MSNSCPTRARRTRARAIRCDIYDRRNFCGIKTLDDFLGGLQKPAGRVQLDDEALVVLIGGHVKGAGNVISRGRTDGTVNFDQPDLGCVSGCHQQQRQNQTETEMFHDSATSTLT